MVIPKKNRPLRQASHSLLVGFAVLMTACNSEPTPTGVVDEVGVRDTFARFIEAMEGHDADAAAQLIQRSVFEQLQNLYGQAIQQPPLQLDSLRPYQRYYIAAYRHWLSSSPTQPVFTGADAFILTVSEEVTLVFLAETTLGSVTVTDNEALAECHFREQPTPAVLSFSRSDGAWRWDMASMDPLIDHALTTLAQASDMEIEEMIFQIIEENTQRPVDRSVLGSSSPEQDIVATDLETGLGSGLAATAADIAEELRLTERRERVREESFFGVISTTDEEPAMDLVFSVTDRNVETILDRVFERSQYDESDIDISEGEGEGTGTTSTLSSDLEASIRSSAAETSGEGTIDDESLTDDLRRHSRDIRRCYERVLPDNPDLSGRIVVEFDIDDRGRTADVSLTENEVGAEVGDCITGRIRRWRFDAPEGGTVTVRKTYIFAPVE